MSQPFSFKRFQDAQRQVQNLLLGGGQSSNILSSFSIEEHTRVHIGAWDIYRAKSSSDNVTDGAFPTRTLLCTGRTVLAHGYSQLTFS